MVPNLYSMLFALSICKLYTIYGYETGDRISTHIMTFHDGYRTPWQDVPISYMPKFRIPEKQVITVRLPRLLDETQYEMALNPNENVKFSIDFADSKIVLPWTKLYNSKEKTTLNKLYVTFEHDEFEVLRLRAEPKYSAPIQRLDPNHPSLKAFEIVYKWQGTQDDDISLGVYALFVMSLIVFILLYTMVTNSYYDDYQKYKTASLSLGSVAGVTSTSTSKSN